MPAKVFIAAHRLVLLPGQAEVRDLGVAVQEQDVVRLHVAMDDVLAVQEVEPLGRLADVADQFALGDAGMAGLAASIEAVAERAIGEFHHDVQPVLRDPEVLGGEQIGVAQVLDEFEGPAFALRRLPSRPVG